MAIIGQGRLAHRGITHVGVAGYPEGHPGIPEEVSWQVLMDKYKYLASQGLRMEIVTQFGFTSIPILSWLMRLRETGIDSPVRVGIPGPASVKSLLRFAARCGVATSTKALTRYGISVTKLLSNVGPDTLVHELARSLNSADHGEVGIHIYPFGGVKRAIEWARSIL